METRHIPAEAAHFQIQRETIVRPLLEGQEVVVYTQSDTKKAPLSIFDQYPNAEKGVVGARPPLAEPKKRGGINWEMMKIVGKSEDDDDAVVKGMYGSQIRAEAQIQADIATRAEQDRLDRIARVRDGLELLIGGLSQKTDFQRAPQTTPLIRRQK